MTNSAKKPAKAKASRDNLDLDLDARLDQATSTLSLDDEPPAGDALDQVLARAKKEIDADLPKESSQPATEEITALLPEENEIIDFKDDLDDLLDNIDENPLEDISPIKSEAMTSLENQLAAAMDSSVVSDEDLDNLLGGAGFDFDSLLGDSNDELTLSETEMNEDSLMAAVDELLNIGVFDEGVVEPETTLDELVEAVEPEIVLDEFVETVEPEIVLDELVETVEPEIVLDEFVEAVEPEIVVDEFVEAVDPEIVVDELVETVEPEIVVDELVEAVDPEIVVDELVEAVDPEIVVDELVETVEPEIVVDELVEAVEPEIVVDELVEAVDPEIVVDELVETVEPEIVVDELVETEEPELETVDESEMTVDKLDDLDVPEDIELTVEPEAALDDLVDSVPFEDTLSIDSNDSEIEDFQEEFNNFDDVADIDAPLVEMSASIESFNDDLDEMQQLEGLNDAMENKNDTSAGFDLLDDDAVEKERATPVDESADDDDWMKQLDGLDEQETETATPVDLDKADDDDWMKQLDGLDEQETEAAAPVDLDKADDDDWMKQLDGLDEQETEAAAPIDLDKADDDDWMKQLDGLDEQETEAAAPVDLDKADDDDWMKQLDGLDAQETEAAAPVDLAKADDDDWMKQLDGLDEQEPETSTDSEWTSEFSNLDDHDEDTAKMLMDANHDTEEDSIVDGKFNITEAEAAKQKASSANSIDEEALIAKAAELAIGQVKDELKGEQDLAFSQLRADQDSIESKSRKQFADAENKRKKTAMFGYIALGAGVIGLMGSAGIGWMSYGTKNDTTNLNQSVTALEEKVNTFLAKNPEKEKEIENIKTSVEQLNQKVDKLAAAQVVVPPVATTAAPADENKTAIPPAKSAEATKSNTAVNLLNSKTPASGSTSPIIDAPKIADTEITPPIADIAPVSPAGDLKAAEPVKLADMAKKSGEAAKEKVAQDTAKEKAAKLAKDEATKAAVKAEAELLTQKIAKATAVAKAAAATTTSKAEEQRKLLTQSKEEHYIGRTTRGMAHAGRDRDNTVETAKAKVGSKNVKEIVNATVKPQKPVPAGKYSVNVISYQQEWFAQSKAAEFKQKGIPVEVAPVDINNYATRYRLKVPGFKSKAEANAYAAKMKKSFNLNEAWVSE